jgi:hypothetical protein
MGNRMRGERPEKWKQYAELNETYVKAGKFTPQNSPAPKQTVLGLSGFFKRLSNGRKSW